MKLKSLIMLGLVVLSLLIMSAVLAQEDHEDHAENGWTIFAHTFETIMIISMVILAFMAAGMFAEGLGKGMKMIASGLILIGINMITDGLHHFGITFIPIAEGTVYHGLVHHFLGIVGFAIMAWGFWKIYKVAKGVGNSKKI